MPTKPQKYTSQLSSISLSNVKFPVRGFPDPAGVCVRERERGVKRGSKPRWPWRGSVAVTGSTRLLTRLLGDGFEVFHSGKRRKWRRTEPIGDATQPAGPAHSHIHGSKKKNNTLHNQTNPNRLPFHRFAGKPSKPKRKPESNTGDGGSVYGPVRGLLQRVPTD